MSQFTQQILPTADAQGNPTGFGKTTVWGYGGNAKDAVTGKYLGYFQFSPSCTFDTIIGVPVRVTWVNNITQPSLFAVDPTIHWANPNNIPMDMGMGMPMPGTPTAPFPTFPPGFDGTQENPAGYYWNAQSPVPLSLTYTAQSYDLTLMVDPNNGSPLQASTEQTTAQPKQPAPTQQYTITPTSKNQPPSSTTTTH